MAKVRRTIVAATKPKPDVKTLPQPVAPNPLKPIPEKPNPIKPTIVIDTDEIERILLKNHDLLAHDEPRKIIVHKLGSDGVKIGEYLLTEQDEHK